MVSEGGDSLGLQRHLQILKKAIFALVFAASTSQCSFLGSVLSKTTSDIFSGACLHIPTKPSV